MPDRKACEDINECNEVAGVCSQQCVNTEGSFFCKCDPKFYEREPDGKTCKRKDNIQPFLIFTNKVSIFFPSFFFLLSSLCGRTSVMGSLSCGAYFLFAQRKDSYSLFPIWWLKLCEDHLQPKKI